MRHAFTIIELLVVIAIVLILCTCLAGDGAFQMLFALLVGWINYPIRLAQERAVDWPSVLTCAGCLVGLTLGMHYFGRWFASTRPAPTAWPWSRTLRLVSLALLMFIAGIAAIGVTHEVVWLATTDKPLTRDRAVPRVQSSNNLKQLALGAHYHVDVAKSLPAGSTFDAQGRGLHGWQTMILPYVEQQNLFRRIDLKQPWNAEANREPMKQAIPVYLHPSISEEHSNDFGLSHYAGNVHVLGARPMTLKDITDGASNTMLMGEVAYGLKPWGMPMNCRDPAFGLGKSPETFDGPLRDITLIALADGTVRVVRNDVSPAVLKALATPRGGEEERLPD
jgi:prepilin-type N-terminal cleavage/methylation domain-containing protein